MGHMVTRALRELSDGSENPEDNDIGKLADTYNAFVDGTLVNQQGFCSIASIEDIREQDYILTPGRYVGVPEEDKDGEPFEEKMVKLTSELYDLFDSAHKLEVKICEELDEFGYGR